MGLFLDPRRRPEDTRSSYSRRRAPYLVLVAIACSAYILRNGHPTGTGWMAMLVIWIAAGMSVVMADWSDLRRKRPDPTKQRPW